VSGTKLSTARILSWYGTSLLPALKITSLRPGVVVHAFNPSTREAEVGGYLSSRLAWSTEWVPGQPGLHREILSRKIKNQKPKKKKKKRKEKKRKEKKRKEKKRKKDNDISSRVTGKYWLSIILFTMNTRLTGLFLFLRPHIYTSISHSSFNFLLQYLHIQEFFHEYLSETPHAPNSPAMYINLFLDMEHLLN
jgi:hypothetical protein